MIERVVQVRKLSESSQAAEDLEYWLSRTPEERIEAVEYLRRQHYGSTEGLQRVARVVERSER